jgi:hypothetical protein
VNQDAQPIIPSSKFKNDKLTVKDTLQFPYKPGLKANWCPAAEQPGTNSTEKAYAYLFFTAA